MNNQTTRDWLLGLAGVAISSAAKGGLVVLVDPATFNFGDGLWNLAKIMAGFAVIGVFNVLQKSPLPGKVS